MYFYLWSSWDRIDVGLEIVPRYYFLCAYVFIQWCIFIIKLITWGQDFSFSALDSWTRHSLAAAASIVHYKILSSISSCYPLGTSRKSTNFHLPTPLPWSVKLQRLTKVPFANKILLGWEKLPKSLLVNSFISSAG